MSGEFQVGYGFGGREAEVSWRKNGGRSVMLLVGKLLVGSVVLGDCGQEEYV